MSAIHGHGQYVPSNQPSSQLQHLDVDKLKEALKMPDHVNDNELCQYVNQLSCGFDHEKQQLLLRFIFVFFRRLDASTKVLLLSKTAEYYPTHDLTHTGVLIRALRYAQEHQLPYADLLRQIDDIEKQFMEQACEVILEAVTVQLLAQQWQNQPPDRARERLEQIKLWEERGCRNAALTLAETVLTGIASTDIIWKEINVTIEALKKGLPNTARSRDTHGFLLEQYSQIAKQGIADSFGDPIAFSQKVEDYLKFAEFLRSLCQIKWAEGILRDLRNLVATKDKLHPSIQAIDAVLKRQTHSPTHRYRWSDFRERLYSLKKSATNCGEFSDGHFMLLKEIIGYVHGLIGQYAPCQYTPLIFGSHYRREVTPLSDSDLAFLIGDPSKQAFFAAHFVPAHVLLVRFYLQCSDDCWIVEPLERNAVQISAIGGDIDEGNLKLYSRNKPFLIHTPEQMVAWMGQKEDDHPEYRYGLFFAQTLFEDSPLFTLFRSLVKKIWQNESHRREISNYFCHWHIRMFPHRHTSQARYNYLEYLPHVKNLKKGWIGPFTLFCFDVAIREGYGEAFQIEHILAQFEEQKLFPSYFIQGLRKAWQTLHEMRWKKLSEVTNEPQRGGPNEIWQKPCTIENPLHRVLLPSLTLEENEILTTIEQQVLIPAYAALEKLHQSGRYLDPLLAVCQKAFNQLPDFRSKVVHVKAIADKLKSRNIPISAVNGLQDIKPSPQRPDKISLPEDLYNWLVDNFCGNSAEQRFVWLAKLLEIEPLFYWIKGDDLRNLVESLICTPTLDGQRIAQDVDLWLFCERIKPLFEAKDHENFCSITLPNLDDPFSQKLQRYYFNSESRREFLQDNGQFVTYDSKHPSLHTAIPIKIKGKVIAWIKACPENSSRELLARELAWGVGDGGVPASFAGKLQRFSRNDVAGDTLSVLLLDDVWGISFDNAGERINQISPASFTQVTLRVAIGRPHDDSPKDYRLQNGRLMRLDNERIFGPTVQKGLLGTEVSLRSVIPFHDLFAKPLDQKALDRFKQINPQDLGKRLLDKLEQIHLLFAASGSEATMFSSEDVKRHFENGTALRNSWNIKTPGPSYLSGVVTREWVVSFLNYLESVHRACQTSGITGMDLFAVVHPEVWKKYKKSWEAKLPGKDLACFERLNLQNFFEKDANGYRSSKVPTFTLLSKAQGYSNLKLSTYLATFGKKEMVLNGEEGKNATYIAIKTLIDDYTKRDYEDMLAKFAKEAPAFVKAFQEQFAYMQSAFLDRVSKSQITENQQQLILQALPGVRSTFHHPDLSYLGQAVTSKALSAIFRSHGKRCLSLTLRRCSALNDVTLIDDSCPSLTKLTLEELPVESVRFPKMQGLTHVFIRRCIQLKKVVIQSPILQTLDLTDSTEVGVIETKSSYLRHIAVKGCTHLTLEQVKQLLGNPYIFEQFENDERLLSSKKQQIIARYPFLLRWGSLPLWMLSRFAAALQAMERHKPLRDLSKKQQSELTRLLDALASSSQKKSDLPSNIKQFELDQKDSYSLIMHRLESENVTQRKNAVEIVGGLVLESPESCDSFFGLSRYRSLGRADAPTNHYYIKYIELTSSETDPDIKKILLKQRLIWLAAGLFSLNICNLHFDFTKIPDDVISQEQEMNHSYRLLKGYYEKLRSNSTEDVSNFSCIESCCKEMLDYGRVEKIILDAFVRAEKHNESIIFDLMQCAFNNDTTMISSRIEVCQALIQLVLKGRISGVLNDFRIIKKGLNDKHSEIRLATNKYLQSLYPACREDIKKQIAETIETKIDQEKDKRVKASLLETLKLYDQTKKDIDVLDRLFHSESEVFNIQEICDIVSQVGEKQPIRYMPLSFRPMLLQGITSKNPENCLGAIKTLGVAEVNDRPEIEALLLAFYQHESSEVRKAALNVLAKPQALPWMLNALIHDNQAIRSAAIEAFFQFNLLEKPDLLQAFVLSVCKLNERNPVPLDIYATGTWILRRLLKQKENGLEQFITLLEKYSLTESASISDLAADIFESVIPKETLQKWLPRFTNVTMRFAAVFPVIRLSQLLGHFHLNEEVINTLKRSLDDRDQRKAALEILWGMQKTYPAATGILREASDDINHELKTKATQWLRKPIPLLPKKSEMLPIEKKRWIGQQELLPRDQTDLFLQPSTRAGWLDRLFDVECSVHVIDRLFYKEGIAHVGTGQPFGFLASSLKDENCWIRLATAEMILLHRHRKAEAVDPTFSVSAIDALVSLLIDGENSVREAALYALQQASELSILRLEDYKRLSQMLKLSDEKVALALARFFLRSPYPILLLEGMADASSSFCNSVYNLLTERDFSLHPCYQFADKFSASWILLADAPATVCVKFIEKLIVGFRKKEIEFDCNALLVILTKLIDKAETAVLQSIEIIAKDLRNNSHPIPTPTDFSNICYTAIENIYNFEFIPSPELFKTLMQWLFLRKGNQIYNIFSNMYALLVKGEHRKQALELMITLGEQLTFEQILRREQSWLEKICLSTLECLEDEKSLALKALFLWLTPKTHLKVFEVLKDIPLDDEWSRQCLEKIGKDIDFQTLLSSKPDQLRHLISCEGAFENLLSQIWKVEQQLPQQKVDIIA